MKLAVVQEPPVWLDREASLDRAVGIIARAAAEGARLVVFPEAWLPGYPTFVWRLRPGADMGATDALFARLLAGSIDLARDELAPIRAAAREHGTVVGIGFNERDPMSGSTLFNSFAIIDADGTIANSHRKLMPTCPERMVWGFGDGAGLRVVETAVGRIGALICWENYMPLARAALYAQDLEIYLAPTWDAGTTWLATMQHVAREGGAWVIGCATPMQASDIPEDVPHRERLFPDPDEWINAGDAMVLRPFGGPVAGPMHKERGLLLAEIEPEEARAARRKFDAAGHYARPDVLRLVVDRRPQRPVRFTDPDEG